MELENELKIFIRMREVKKEEKVDDAEGKNNKRSNNKMDKEMIDKNLLKEVMGMEGTSMGTGNGNDELMAKELEKLKKEVTKWGQKIGMKSPHKYIADSTKE
jgi:hypothetical protein